MEWIQGAFGDIVQSISDFGPAALVVLALWLGAFVLPKTQQSGTKDVSWWLCWIVFGAASFTVLGLFIVNRFDPAPIFRGGDIVRVPARMDLVSEADSFFVAKRPSPADPNNLTDYRWLTLNRSDRNGIDVQFLIRRNIQTITRDTASLAVVGSQVDPAAVECKIHVSKDKIKFLDNHQLTYTLRDQFGARPVLVEVDADGHDEIQCAVLDTSIAQLFPFPRSNAASLFSIAWAADASNIDKASDPLDVRLNSPSTAVRAQGARDLLQNFDDYKEWTRRELEDANTPLNTRAAIISILRSKYSDSGISLLYPSPAELSFLSERAYVRIILDGLDISTSLGLNSRRFLNGSRDSRVLQAFQVVRNNVFPTGVGDFSCPVLFELSVTYNWAALSADNLMRSAINSHIPIQNKDIDQIMNLVNIARGVSTNLTGTDRVESNRLEYFLGTFFGRLAIDQAIPLDPSIDRSDLLSRSKTSFQSLLKVSDHERLTYHYPFHFEVARAFVELPSTDVLALKGVNAVTIPDRSCADPAQTL